MAARPSCGLPLLWLFLHIPGLESASFLDAAFPCFADLLFLDLYLDVKAVYSVYSQHTEFFFVLVFIYIAATMLNVELLPFVFLLFHFNPKHDLKKNNNYKTFIVWATG